MKYQFIFWMNVSINLPTISAIVRPLVNRPVGLPRDGLKPMPLGGLLALDTIAIGTLTLRWFMVYKVTNSITI